MNRRRGFTLVELVVVIAVIAILATLATLGLSRYLADGRDTKRTANITTISEALEKYYDQNGEYPSCSALTGSSAEVTTATLKGLDASALRTPGASSATNNSIKCGVTLTTTGDDFIQYVGDGSPDCTGTGSCLTYALRYKSETDNTIKEVASRRQADFATSGVPTITVGTVTVESVALSWSAVANAASYTVQRATNAGFTANFQQYTSTTPNLNVTGLSSNTLYYFRVNAVSGVTASAWSASATATTPSLTAPTINSGQITSTTQLTLGWTSIPSATRYTLQYSTNSGFTSPTTVSNITSTSQAVSSLTSGTLYYFRVRAEAGVSTESAWSATYQGGATGIPTNVLATAASCGGATITWTASVGATSYHIEYSTSASFTASTTITGITGTSNSPSGLPQNATVYFRMYALVGSAKTVASGSSSALITICAPTTNTMSCSGGSAANCTSNAVCAAGTTAEFRWTANGGLWVSGSAYRSVSYSLGYGAGITLALQTRCYVGAVYSSYATASPSSYGYTRGVPAPTLNGLNLYSGRRVTTSWNSICGGTYELYLTQGSYVRSDRTPRASYNPGNPAAGSYEDPYSTTDNRVWTSGGTVNYQVRALCNGVWSGWSNVQSRAI